MFTLGFDVAKDKIDVALINKGGKCIGRYQVANNVSAIAKLLRSAASRHNKLQVGCEATSYYHLTVAKACSAVGLACYALNPLLTRQFIRSTVRGRKTDRDDALSIARLVLRGEGSLVVLEPRLLAQSYVRLASRVQHQKQSLGLQEQFFMAIHETMGLEAESPFAGSLETLSELVNELRSRASKLVNADEIRLLRTIPGVGPIVATTILAEIGSITRFSNPKQVVAFAGLDPRVKQSGATLLRNTKLTKRGAAELRRVLFLGAGVARQYDPEMAAYYQKKRNEGKSYTAAIVATARKLCYRIYAVLQRGTPYVKT